MKLTKTASGKKKLSMSRKEWTSIGKKAGWMKKAQNFSSEIGNDQDINSKITKAKVALDWCNSVIKLVNDPKFFESIPDKSNTMYYTKIYANTIAACIPIIKEAISCLEGSGTDNECGSRLDQVYSKIMGTNIGRHGIYHNAPGGLPVIPSLKEAFMAVV